MPRPAPTDRPAPGGELRAGRVIAAQWVAVTGGPMVVLLGQHLLYAAVPGACRAGDAAVVALHAGAAATVALAALVALVAWREWRRVGGGWPGDEGGAEGRGRMLAAVGLALAGFFALLALWQWVPMFVLSPCQGA